MHLFGNVKSSSDIEVSLIHNKRNIMKIHRKNYLHLDGALRKTIKLKIGETVDSYDAQGNPVLVNSVFIAETIKHLEMWDKFYYVMTEPVLNQLDLIVGDIPQEIFRNIKRERF